MIYWINPTLKNKLRQEWRINTCLQYVRPRRERLDRPDGDDEDREVDLLDDGAGPGARMGNRSEICQKINTTQFAGKRILHTENAEIMAIFARNKIT